MSSTAREGDALSLDSEPDQVDSKPNRSEHLDNSDACEVTPAQVSVDPDEIDCEVAAASFRDHDSHEHTIDRSRTLLGPGRSVTAPEVAFSMPFSPGQLLLNTYEVLSLIAAGRSTFVVAAVDRGFGRQVALKFLKPEFSEDPEVSRRFAHQAKLQCSVRSEHVARVFQVDEFPDGQPFVVMERLHGIGLRTLLRTHGRVPLDHACEFVLQACEGLAAAHRARIVHGEIAPEHLFLAHADAPRERLKLLDLGLSRELPHDHRGELPDAMLGSPYASVRDRGEGPLDVRADIRSLGMTLCELLLGEETKTHSEAGAVDAALSEQLPARLTGDGMAAVRAIIERCLAIDPRQTFRSVAELAEALVPFAPARARTHAERCARTLNERPRADEVDLLGAPGPDGELETLRIALTEPFGPSVAGGTRGSLATLALVAACASAAFVFTYREVSSSDADTPARSAARVSAAAVAPPAQTLDSQPHPAAPLHQIVIEQLDTDVSERPAPRAAPDDVTGAARSPERPTASRRTRNAAEAGDVPARSSIRSPKPAGPASEPDRARVPRLLPSEPDVGF